MSSRVTPLSLKEAPALIERLLPVQKLSVESYKEQMAVHGKTLTALGGYWKGRKPLILNKACILGCLLPATDDPARDLDVFEKLMGMDLDSLVKRLENKNDKDSNFILRAHRSVGHDAAYREWVDAACRPEECGDDLFSAAWGDVNDHLGTDAHSFPELVEQLGVMRFGHRPRVADTFCGSGQIPFEAARLGCDVYASDLNPVACMLTWAAFNVVGASEDKHKELARQQRELVESVQRDIDQLGVETDGAGWRGKVYLYCVEARCPQTGWMVPLLPSLVISKGYRVVAELVPDSKCKRYEIVIRCNATDDQLAAAAEGTVSREERFGDAYLVHQVNSTIYKTKISTLRGDYEKPDGTVANKVRPWDKHDVRPRPEDLFQERLYCVQWMRPKKKGRGDDYEFRSVASEDLERERVVEAYAAEHLAEWQANGWAPDMRIEPGEPPRYQGLDLIRSRGWTHWNHVFNPRQLLVAVLLRKRLTALLAPAFAQSLNSNSRLSPWSNADGGGGAVKQTFANQALNTLFNYGCRGSQYAASLLLQNYKSFPLKDDLRHDVHAIPADKLDVENDLYVTDPPYGDAVKYEEILDFFVAWFRRSPPREFSKWTWDGRRALAIKGEGEDFRRGMVAAYTRMTDYMPANGMQVIMFTHQSGSIWADMANIVWASGLRVTAAWYVVTETESALREGSYVKGTVLLVLRKRDGSRKTTRDDLAWEIQEEVEAQVLALAGLNQKAKALYRDRNVFEDADIQMAGYAAALRALTRYSVIDGRDMAAEANRPRVRGESTFVDGLIAFAVDTANQCLVPQGLSGAHWDKLTGAERFYLKMLDMEAKGAKTLDNYQNFAKAFKVHDFRPLLGSLRANEARLKSAVEFGRSEMGEGSELHESVLRAVLYAVMELVRNVDGNEVLAHLTLNIPNYYGDMTQRELAIELSSYLEKRLEASRPEEASAARVLRELVKNQRLG
jgi:putative DNA methylase